MGQTITVTSPLLTSIDSVSLTAAQRAAVWEIAAVLDERRVAADQEDAIWVEIETARLRGPDARNDNVWLRELLDRLTGVKLGGTWKGDRWGGVLLAEWRIERGGSLARLLLPPSGVRAIRSPETFAKIDAEAVHRLPPHARTLYGLLADRQRQTRREWTPELDELKTLMGVSDRYRQYKDFRRRVLDPAVTAIRDFGVIDLHYEPVRLGRGVRWVRFTWDLKDPHAATDTAVENERHSAARGKEQESADAPPLVVVDQATRWLQCQDSDVIARWAKRAESLGAQRAVPRADFVHRWVSWVAQEIAEIHRLSVD